ncbi:hypothetical protein A9R01_04580 ['Osedax' symbiont bacterium Rs2_46_30_T18]|nr:hypothetical protein A9R01_04580 ['Osedax' symbiont bacterium Rs2_46_30_T18]
MQVVWKEQKFKLREQQILECTLALLSDQHWQDISVADIASVTGIGKGTIYKHFDCKDDIYAQLLLSGFEALLDNFKRIVADTKLSGIQQMHAIIICAFEFHRDDAVHSKIYLACKEGGFRDRLSEKFKQQLQSVETAVIELFSIPILKGVKEGGITAVIPLEVIILGMSATFEGAIMRIQNSRDAQQQSCPLQDQYIPLMADYMVSAMANGPVKINFLRDDSDE